MQGFKGEIKVFLVVAIVALVVGIGGISLFQNFIPEKEPVDDTPVQTNRQRYFTTQEECENMTVGVCAYSDKGWRYFGENKQDQLIGELDTSGWQTYRHEEFGFEVKYPQDVNVQEQEKEYTEVAFRESGQEFFRLLVGDRDNVSLTNREITYPAGRLDFSTVVERKQQSVNGITWDIVTMTSIPTKGIGTGGWKTQFSTQRDSMLYLLECNNTFCDPGAKILNESDQEELDLFLNILSTFRFVESERKTITVSVPGEGRGQTLSQELVVEVPVYIDEETIETWVVDINEDGRPEVILTALQSVESIPEYERYSYSNENLYERKKYMQVSTLNDRGEFESVGELTEYAAGNSIIFDKVEDINQNGQSEILMSYTWVGASFVNIDLIATIDVVNRELDWLEMQTKEGDIKKVSLGIREALMYAFWYEFRDLDGDGVKELIHYNVSKNYNESGAASVKDCVVNAHKWSGLFYVYNEALSARRLLEVGNTCGWRDFRG